MRAARAFFGGGGGGGGGGGATRLGDTRTGCRTTRGALGCVGSASLRTILQTLMNFLALLAWFSRLVFFGNFAMSSFFESLTRLPLTSLVTLKPRFLTFSLSFSYSI